MWSIFTTSGLFSCSFNFTPRTKWILQNLASYQGHNRTSVHQMHRALYPAVLLQLHLQNTAYINCHGQQALGILSIGIKACSRSKRRGYFAFNFLMSSFSSQHFLTELLVSLNEWREIACAFSPVETWFQVVINKRKKKMSFILSCIFTSNLYFSLRKHYNKVFRKIVWSSFVAGGILCVSWGKLRRAFLPEATRANFQKNLRISVWLAEAMSFYQ